LSCLCILITEYEEVETRAWLGNGNDEPLKSYDLAHIDLHFLTAADLKSEILMERSLVEL